jgi:hypothetical protein
MATSPALTQQASRGRDDAVVTGLVTRARNGERQAWDALVERYAPLIWSICRGYRLDAADAQDAAQNVWLRLVDRHCYCPGNLPTSLDLSAASADKPAVATAPGTAVSLSAAVNLTVPQLACAHVRDTGSRACVAAVDCI